MVREVGEERCAVARLIPSRSAIPVAGSGSADSRTAARTWAIMVGGRR